MGGVLGTVSGRNRCRELGYGYTILDTTKLQPTMDPDLWFLNDEPDAEENNQGNTHCGTGTRIPCDTSKYAGTFVAAGRAQPHHILPGTGWVSFYLRQEEDVEKAVTLLHESYQIAQKQKSKTIEVQND